MPPETTSHTACGIQESVSLRLSWQ